MAEPAFVRFEAAAPNARGTRPGIFALANGLAHDGLLSNAEHAEWRRRNDRLNAAYSEPGSVDPSIFDRSVNPGAVCWFKSDARRLVAECDWYLDLLDRHAVAWRLVRSDHPGRILYEDEVQVVAAAVLEPTSSSA